MDEISLEYRLAVSSGYKANILKIGVEDYDTVTYTNKYNLPDVEVTRPSIDTEIGLLDSKCLMTINGYIQSTLFSDGRLYIPGGTESMLKSRSNQLGILSFNSLDTNLRKTKVTTDMVSEDQGHTLYEKALITFPDEVENCFLVLAGYLVFEQPEFFYRVSGNTFALRLDKLNYIERIFELEKYRNIYDELGIEVSVNNPNAFEGDTVRSNETVTKFLTLDNTFLVETPGYAIETNKIYLEHSNVPGNFRTELEPVLPFIGGQGKLIEYKKVKNNTTKHTVCTNDAYYNNYLFSRMDTNSINMYNANREVGNTYGLSSGFFIDVKMTKI